MSSDFARSALGAILFQVATWLARTPFETAPVGWWRAGPAGPSPGFEECADVFAVKPARKGDEMTTTRLVRRASAVALLALTLVVLILVLLGASGTVASVLVVAFALTAPGWVVARFMDPESPVMEWTIAVAAGVSIVILLAMALLVTGLWYPAVAVGALALATAAGLIVHLVRLNREKVVA